MTKPKTAEAKPKAAEKQTKPAVSQNGHKPAERSTKPAAKSTAVPKPAAKPDEPKLLKFQGLLQEYNYSPQGAIEGFMLQNADGVTVQINVAPEVGIAVLLGLYHNVEATVEPEDDKAKHGKGDHSVYRLITLTGENGKALIHARGGAGEIVTVQGVVKRINYTRHGEANGVVLESGEFIHLKPDGMKHAGLKVADQITATGPAGMMPLGQQVIEATTINGAAVKSKKPSSGGNHRAR